LLTADLQDSARAFHGVGEQPAFANGHGEWLFEIHIQSGLQRENRSLRVMMIRRSNDDGVEFVFGFRAIE